MRERRDLDIGMEDIRSRLNGLGPRLENLRSRGKAIPKSLLRILEKPSPTQSKTDRENFLIVLKTEDKADHAFKVLSQGSVRPHAATSSSSTDRLTYSLHQQYAPRGGLVAVWNRISFRLAGGTDLAKWLLIALAIMLALSAPVLISRVISQSIEGPFLFSLDSPRETVGGSGDERASPVETPIPGSGFSGAYILGVSHTSSTRSMLRIYVPAGLEGNYGAIVKISQEEEFHCVVMEEQIRELICVGPRLSQGMATIKIFRLIEGGSSATMVFETSYYVLEEYAFVPDLPPAPTLEPSSTPTATLVVLPSSGPGGSSGDEGSEDPPKLRSSATPVPVPSEAPVDTPISPDSTLGPPTDPPKSTTEPKKCKGPDHPKFPCTPEP